MSLPSRISRRAPKSAAVALAAMLSFGCGKASSTESGWASPIAPECQGFPMENLRYSPGGDTLPDICRPFDPLTNNPFAVRCVDALAGYATRYPGDDYCILPPPPEKGAQIGVHPQAAKYWEEMWAGDLGGYSDDRLTGPFEVLPGGEVEQTYRMTMGNPEPQSYYRIDSRMRVGSHHMATYKTSSTGDEGWRPPDGAFVPEGADGGFLWNSQRSNTDRPVSSLDIPDEDQGLGASLSAKQGVLIDLHHFNTLDVNILREAWINLWWVDGPVTRAVEDNPLLAQVEVPPNAVTALEGKFEPKIETRVISLFGHRHAWTRRINAWVLRADGTEEPVYDSYDWLDVPTYSYDSLSTNPVADPGAHKDGAASGILMLHVGDQLRFTCHVDTTAAHATELGVPVPTVALTFGNKAFDAEMCILYAQMAGPATGAQ